MSGSGVFNLAHICVLFRSYGAMPMTNIFQVHSVIAWAFCHGRLLPARSTREQMAKIYFARDYYICCLLACLNFPEVGIDCLYMDMYYFGQTCYFRIIIWFSLKLCC